MAGTAQPAAAPPAPRPAGPQALDEAALASVTGGGAAGGDPGAEDLDVFRQILDITRQAPRPGGG